MDIIKQIEDRFDCQVGEARAMHQVGDKCLPYVMYAICGPDIESLNYAMLNTFRSLKDEGGTRLWWRYPEKISAEVDGDTYYVHARVAVTDDDLNTITLPERIKPEGEPTPRIND